MQIGGHHVSIALPRLVLAADWPWGIYFLGLYSFLYYGTPYWNCHAPTTYIGTGKAKGGKKKEIDTTGKAIATGTGTGKRIATEMFGFGCLFLSK